MDVDFNIVRTNIKKGLDLIWEYIHVELVRELNNQGHIATSDLINSIEKRISETENLISLDGMFIEYGRYVDTGRKAGVKRVPIEALEKWIIQKGFESDAKKIRGMAFAIQRTIFEIGISTPESHKGTTTKDWMTKTLESLSPRIATDIETLVGEQLDLIISNVITEASEWYQTAA